MKPVVPLLLLALLLGGCVTSTVDSRRKERFAAYESLTPEIKTIVDQGQIKVGMNEDAVYIAWGAPTQITHGETKTGKTTIWLYQGTWLQESRFWNYRVVRNGDHRFVEQYLDHDYYPRSYVRAEITFAEGIVSDWRTLPAPAY